MGFNFNRKKFASRSAPLYSRDVLRAGAALDYPSIAAAASATLTIAVPGARVGHDVVVTPEVPVAGLVYVAYVSANDVVTVRATNVTGGAIDAASSAFRVLVFTQY